MSQIGIFVNRILLETNVSFFGNVYYYAMWVFEVAFLIGAVVACVKRKSSNIEEPSFFFY